MEKIVQAAQVGRRRFLEKLGWLKNYKEDLETYKQMVELVKIVLEQVKNDGLNQDSQQLFDSRTQTQILNPRLEKFQKKIREYLQTEVSKIPLGETLLATSDIIESIFGKYKNFSASQPLKELGKMVLIIPLCTIQLTAVNIKEAMEKIRTRDVEAWSQQVLGQSMLSKRKAMLARHPSDTKIA